MGSNIRERVRQLRKNQTDSEEVIWELVRNRQIKGQKFLRQHPILFEYDGKKRFFVADFYCAKKKLIVEIDGKIHEQQADHDRFRDYLVERLGMTVIQFTNEEVEYNLAGVFRKLEHYL
jgi:very-short-patch-repair endonuclease